MSSSRQNAQCTSPMRSSFETTAKSPQWWDTLPAVLNCPECGKKSMRRISGPCQLLDGTLIPELERFQCSSCKANFFDDAAMHTIDSFRHKARRTHRGTKAKTEAVPLR